ncbi:hypothetical protein Moror_2912 [Moniliophthora roreri MCA 2997]|uniref:Uncharacterized protein n=1 Tax=Moniliophthora roreri (strain MCA 2997) TaxID=1381753 RepID=V2XBW2_MONRO|nr:hypothetical protein Moror_2912 [Moniliophthora roreri MCA 2997]
MAFSGVSDLNIEGDAVNIVQGDQNNHHITAEIIHIHGSSAMSSVERTEYDEFEYVKWGHIYKLKEIAMVEGELDYESQDCRAEELDVTKTVYTAQIHGMRESTFTALTYRGKDAELVWKRDFLRFARTEHITSVQLFGLNRSQIPTLIFYEELIPLGQICRREHFWTTIRLGYSVLHQLSCHSDELWLNSRNGRICSGPVGPQTDVRWVPVPVPVVMPPDSDLLKDHLAFRQLLQLQRESGSRLDNYVISVASDYWMSHSTTFRWLHPDLDCSRLFFNLATCQPNEPFLPDHRLPQSESIEDVVGAVQQLRFDTVYSSSGKAIARCPRLNTRYFVQFSCIDHLEADVSCFIESGLPCFKVIPACQSDVIQRITITFHVSLSSDLDNAWLCQAASILHNEASDEPDYLHMVMPDIKLSGSIEGFLLQDPNEPSDDCVRPIYLFLHSPFKNSWSDLASWANGRSHYWSYDKNGESEIPGYECDLMGLPRTFEPHVELYCKTWPKYINDAMRNWQMARGFDPRTTDFARYLGYEPFEILEHPSRREEVAEKPQSRRKWFWEAGDDADFSAFAI